VSLIEQPKLLPLKSVTLEKLERMQKEANQKAKEMEQEKELEQVYI
jgi:maleate cis-trans isomerase